MRFLLLNIFVICTIAFAAEEASIAHKKAAERLLTALQVKEQIENQANAELEMIKEDFEELYKIAEPLYREHFTYEKMKDLIIIRHVDLFTEEELNRISAFYETPAGKKFLNAMPILYSQIHEVYNIAREPVDLILMAEFAKMVAEQEGQEEESFLED